MAGGHFWGGGGPKKWPGRWPDGWNLAVCCISGHLPSHFSAILGPPPRPERWPPAISPAIYSWLRAGFPFCSRRNKSQDQSHPDTQRSPLKNCHLPSSEIGMEGVKTNRTLESGVKFAPKVAPRELGLLTPKWRIVTTISKSL